MHEAADSGSEEVTLLKRNIPTVRPATPEEIERRGEIVTRILRRRERVGPIGLRADELLHESRVESDH